MPIFSIGPIARSALMTCRKSICGALLSLLALAPAAAQAADQPAPAPIPIPVPSAQPQGVTIQVLYVKEDREKELPLSLLDQPSPDDGIAGAKLGIADDNTTGRFLNQSFKLDVLEGNVDDLIKGATEKVAAGDAFIIADMEPDSLLKFADALKDKPAQIFNVGNPDDRLREEDCRANVMHTAPTRTMLADALTQYLVWKRWPKWVMVVGPSPKDQLLADAYRRAAKKFGAKIVQELPFKIDTGNRRADGGYEQIQQQIPQFLQNVPDHDVVLVVDEDQVFADYFLYRTWIPRPIVGSSGLVPSSWHPSLELWGGTQFQNRFKKLTGRIMRNIDYDAWVATRAIGEAASRKQTSDFKTLRDFIHSPNFEVAAFKGVATSFRGWNGQLREPLIVGSQKLFVSVSPQQGFLHQFSVLDTLGIDKPETKCNAYTQ
ncbi:MAG: ABC transporter substrate-binding protein [Hyphomicrobium sp.]|uniref:ABC transporter substrate-binding protein n=1 Tax=Hyphomicrobium sp. TaxID=82 RepID=UPI0039E61DA7